MTYRCSGWFLPSLVFPRTCVPPSDIWEPQAEALVERSICPLPWLTKDNSTSWYVFMCFLIYPDIPCHPNIPCQEFCMVSNNWLPPTKMYLRGRGKKGSFCRSLLLRDDSRPKNGFFFGKFSKGGGVNSVPKNYIADFVGFRAVYFG